MKVKRQELKAANSAFSAILGQPIESKLSYRICRVADKVMKALEEVEKVNRALVTEYGVKNGDRISVPEAKMKDYRDALEKKMQEEVELDIVPIPWEIIEKGGAKISGFDMASMFKFVEGPKDVQVL